VLNVGLHPLQDAPRSGEAGLIGRLARPFARGCRWLRSSIERAATRRAIDALDDRLRDDVGLPPRRPPAASFPPVSDGWMR
jgi:hypothetical protein